MYQYDLLPSSLGQIAMSFYQTCSFPGQCIFLYLNDTKVNEAETAILF